MFELVRQTYYTSPLLKLLLIINQLSERIFLLKTNSETWVLISLITLLGRKMKNKIFHRVVLGLGLLFVSTMALADRADNRGLPVCLEGNFMVADAQNAPFSSASGPGRILEIDIMTGDRGVTFGNPFSLDNIGTPIVPENVDAPGPWKPTGVLSGGLRGHAYISGAAQHTMTEFHRDGTPIRTKKLPMDDDPRYGTVPRLLGSQMMPNGNIIQNVCDANFFNAVNSDTNPDGSNASNNYFPPVFSTTARALNSRMLVLDQETLEVIDEYSAPDDPRWTCMAGTIFNDEGMYVSMFHGAAVFVIDWKAGLDSHNTGIGSNKTENYNFEFDRKKNQAKVIRVIDFLDEGNGAPLPALDDPRRRDSLRAITFDESGNLYATFRARSRACLENEVPGTENGCNPSVFRQHIAIVPDGLNYPTRTIALDPGVNIIAGIRTNRISAQGCAKIRESDPTNRCNFETLYIASSAFNAGCETEVQGPNKCFVPGGRIAEYRIDADHLDAIDGTCSGDPNGDNSGCAQPIATFLGEANGDDNIDPRMLMTIHEAFVQ